MDEERNPMETVPEKPPRKPRSDKGKPKPKKKIRTIDDIREDVKNLMASDCLKMLDLFDEALDLQRSGAKVSWE